MTIKLNSRGYTESSHFSRKRNLNQDIKSLKLNLRGTIKSLTWLKHWGAKGSNMYCCGPGKRGEQEVLEVLAGLGKEFALDDVGRF